MLMKECFLPSSLPLLAEDVLSAAEILVETLKPYAQSGKECDLHLGISLFHMKAIGEAALGYGFGSMDLDAGMNDFHKGFEFMLKELPRRAFSTDPTLREDYESDNPDNRAFKKAADTVRVAIGRVIGSRLEERARGKRRADMMEAILVKYEEDGGLIDCANKEALTEALGDNLIEIIFAGYNTAVGVIANVFYYLEKEPVWQSKLVEEGRRVLTASKRALKGEALMAVTAELEVSRMVVLEALRLAPPASMIARRTTQEKEVNGVLIPKDVEV